jgi:hypothetical protein
MILFFEFFHPFPSSSIDLFAGEFIGLLSGSFNAEIQCELPPLSSHNDGIHYKICANDEQDNDQ